MDLARLLVSATRTEDDASDNMSISGWTLTGALDEPKLSMLLNLLSALVVVALADSTDSGCVVE